MDEDFSQADLELAFGWHVVNQLLGADGVVVPTEQGFLERTFPRAKLAASGFVDARGAFTPRWQDALGEALLQLPALPVAERVRLIETLFGAALADDVFEKEEGEVVVRIARLLGLKDDEYAGVIDRLVTNEVALDSEDR